MCMFDGDSYWKLAEATMRRARKPHRCGECARTIVKGERYEHFSGLDDDSDAWYTAKTCQHCLAARRWLLVACSGYIFEAVHADIGEHWSESNALRTVALGRLKLAGASGRQWQHRDGTATYTPLAIAKWVEEALEPIERGVAA